MKLYLGAFQWGKTATLTDHAGRARYRLEGDAYALGKRLHVKDLAGREAVFIRQVIPSLLPRCEIEVYGKPMGALVKDLTYARPKFRVEGTGWELMGVVGALDFQLLSEGEAAACAPDPEDPARLLLTLQDRNLFALGALLAAACIFAPQEPRHL